MFHTSGLDRHDVVTDSGGSRVFIPRTSIATLLIDCGLTFSIPVFGWTGVSVFRNSKACLNPEGIRDGALGSRQFIDIGSRIFAVLFARKESIDCYFLVMRMDPLEVWSSIWVWRRKGITAYISTESK